MSLSERLTINLLYPVLVSLTLLESLDSQCVKDMATSPFPGGFS
jgi:hypothetical protein